MCHGFVERDVFEDLDTQISGRRRSIVARTHLNPGKKHGEGHDVVELNLPVGEKFEISETVGILQQFVEDLSHFDLSVDIESNAHVRDGDDDHIQDIPDRFEVVEFEMGDLDETIHLCLYRERHSLRSLPRRCNRP